MGADPIAICGKCREIIAYFHLTRCVYCLNEYYNFNMNEKDERVLTYHNYANRSPFYPHCSYDDKCEEFKTVELCVKKGHKVLIDPCW